jgi:hypothetical protein
VLETATVEDLVEQPAHPRGVRGVYNANRVFRASVRAMLW